jgi:dimeric dUTPase (all-alpha-NTP-PPase superfamily)
MLENLRFCVELQEKMNATVNPAWRTAGYRWERAAMIEAVELFDHIGWKWWKKQDIDREQSLLELVDIFHFLISFDLVQGFGTPDDLAQSYQNIYKAAVKKTKVGQDKEYIFERVTQFVEVASAYNEVSPSIFFEIVVALGFTLEDIVKWYIGKNVLNQFRQANGYKQGTYVKNWATPEERAQGTEYEDNFILAQLLNANPLITAEELEAGLQAHYALVK